MANNGDLSGFKIKKQNTLARWVHLTIRLYLATCPMYGNLRCITNTLNRVNFALPINITLVILNFLQKL